MPYYYKFEVFMVMTMKIVVFWYATDVARLKDTDVSSDHSAVIMCLLSAPRRSNLNSSKSQNQKLGQTVTLHVFGLSWPTRC
jgi:hypothetical protein